MEYQYHLDSTTGNSRAIFSLEHEVIGPWLEVEIGNDTHKLTQVLQAIDSVYHHNQQEVVITGSEYSIIIDKDDVQIKANTSLNGDNKKSDVMLEQDLDFADTSTAMCGADDFREMLLSWSNFITK
jgi:uncharacterized protein YacL (UPF0231 family)